MAGTFPVRQHRVLQSEMGKEAGLSLSAFPHNRAYRLDNRHWDLQKCAVSRTSFSDVVQKFVIFQLFDRSPCISVSAVAARYELHNKVYISGFPTYGPALRPTEPSTQ
jgi:hypothetical protein